MKKLYSSLVRLNSLQFKYRTSISFVIVFIFILFIDFIFNLNFPFIVEFLNNKYSISIKNIKAFACFLAILFHYVKHNINVETSISIKAVIRSILFPNHLP